jgi:hypothetical protein
MANPYHHAVSSVRKFGGKVTDYLSLHEWFDQTKEHFADFRHRALRHHSLGIYECMRIFGDDEHCITNSDGKKVPVRWIGEQHCREDCGYVPSVQDWLQHLKPEKWMGRPPIKLERELELTEGEVTV